MVFKQTRCLFDTVIGEIIVSNPHSKDSQGDFVKSLGAALAQFPGGADPAQLEKELAQELQMIRITLLLLLLILILTIIVILLRLLMLLLLLLQTTQTIHTLITMITISVSPEARRGEGQRRQHREPAQPRPGAGVHAAEVLG